jgi:arginase family enzyme
MRPLEELATILRPAGGGIHLVSAGKAEQLAVQRRLYGARTEAEVKKKFLATLERLPSAKGALLGIPSDVGAGFQRGANLGPQGIRERLLKERGWAKRCEALGLIDVGDVFVVPQLLHDEMLSAEQLKSSRAALYPDVTAKQRAGLPVAPLSIAERAWDLMFEVNPKLKPFVLGGDHSTALPGVLALGKVRRKGTWGIVQIDAHTDLLETRLGVKYCFGTWSWHANELMGRHQRMVQVGIRASGRTREHWESTLDVRQFWAREVLADPRGAVKEIVEHVRETGVEGVYFSNDIDGTDEKWADATGTPEPGGLTPKMVVELIRALGREGLVLGGDVMEVAPILTRTPQSAERTVGLAVEYLKETVEAALGRAR